MPQRGRRRYNNRRYNNRRNFRRRNNRYNRKKASALTLRRMPFTIVPDRAQTRLKYSIRLAPTEGVGGAYTYQFRGNSVFDPDFTGIGGQPAGFDQWKNFYDRYFVYASKINVKVIDVSGSAAPVISEVAITPTTDSLNLVGVDPQLCMEQAYSRFGITTTHTGARPFNMSNYMTTSKMFGIPRITSANSSFAATTSANPTSPWYWNYNMQVVDQSTTMANVFVYITLTYYVEFHRRTEVFDGVS